MLGIVRMQLDMVDSWLGGFTSDRSCKNEIMKYNLPDTNLLILNP